MHSISLEIIRLSNTSKLFFFMYEYKKIKRQEKMHFYLKTLCERNAQKLMHTENYIEV